MMEKEKVSCRVVVISVFSKSKRARFMAPSFANMEKCVKKENWYTAETLAELKEAFGKVRNGDILVINAHANEGRFIYGKSIEPDPKTKKPLYDGVPWTGDKKNPSAWKFLGIQKPPKLAAFVIAACMKTGEEERDGKVISSMRMREIRSAFNTRILITPKASFDDSKEDPAAMEDIVKSIKKFYNEEIDGADLNESINRKHERIRVSFGCNGRNHPDGCICRFGPNWNHKK